MRHPFEDTLTPIQPGPDKQLLASLFPRMFNYLYPTACPSCVSTADTVSFAPFCSDCWNAIEKYSGPSCGVCATPFASDDARVCLDCLRNPPPFVGVFSYGLYERVLSAAIHSYKFHGIRRLHRPLGKLLLELDIPESDAVLYVPLSKMGLRKRGFNQSLLLAKILSDKRKIPLIMDALFKQIETPSQIGLSAKARIKNLRGAFRADRKIRGMRLLLVDDVMTTGATARICSQELLDAGAREVTVLTLARASAL